MTSPKTPAPHALKRRFDHFLRSNATKAILPIGLVVGWTGVMMFFRWYKESVQGMHEWLGLGLVAAMALHLLRNRLPLSHTVKQKRVLFFLLIVTVVVLGFLGFQPAAKPNPGRLAVQALSHAPLKALPLTLNRSATELASQLEALGIQSSDDSLSLTDLAAQVHQPASWLITELLGKK